MPIFLLGRAARMMEIWAIPLSLPVRHRFESHRPSGTRITRHRLVICNIAAATLLGSVGATGAQQATDRVASTVAIVDRISGFVEAASQRFRVPAPWIRAVMQVESRGWVNAVSPKGAMGLMQIMPDTWAELQSRYSLGADPFDPHDNIVAGTAYLRELLDRFGEPGFLAAYNAGPARYQDYLATGKPLPSETLAYISAVTSGPASPLLDGVNGPVSWTSSSLFAATTSSKITPPRMSANDRRGTNSASSPEAAARPHAPHSDGLFAPTAGRGAHP